MVKAVWLLPAAWSLVMGTVLVAGDGIPVPPSSSKTAFCTEYRLPRRPTSDVTCPLCKHVLFNNTGHQKRIAVLPCAHMEHLFCYKKRNKNLAVGQCSVCYEPAAKMIECGTQREVIPALQQTAFALERTSTEQSQLVAELTEALGCSTAAVLESRTALRDSRTQVDRLTHQLRDAEYSNARMHGAVCIVSGIIVMAIGASIINNARTRHASGNM